MAEIQTQRLIKFTISRKLILATILNLLLIAMLGGYVATLLFQIKSEVGEIASVDLPRMHSLTTIETHLLEQEVHFEKVIRLAEEIQLVKRDQNNLLIKTQAFNHEKLLFRELSGKVNREIDSIIMQVKADIDDNSLVTNKTKLQNVLVGLSQVKTEHLQFEEHTFNIFDSIKLGEWDHTKHQEELALIEQEAKELTYELSALRQIIYNVIQDLLSKAKEQGEDGSNAIIFFVFISLILSLMGSLVLARLITKPLAEIKSVTYDLIKGDLTRRIFWRSDDEIGELSLSINEMIVTLNNVADQADAIAGGDFDKEIMLKGDQDRLSIALNEMKFQIQQRNEELLKQNALKSQVVRINELTQGATDLTAMADNIISALAQMMKAGNGVIYTYKKADNGLTLTGSYAFKKRKAILPLIAIGEGLVGQCAKEQKTILLTQVPSDYIQINSGLGQSSPLNVLVIPVLFEEALIGVIELASFNHFNDEQIQVIELISSNLGIVFNNLSNQAKTQALLLETQSQSEELQAQQEELRSTNENLLEQTQQLKTSEEELKQQSEELKVSNEELEEKQVFLKRQKNEIEAAKADLSVKAEELAQASKYKSEFLANMSHELRTPLNSLLLLAKGLADNKLQHLDETEVEDAKIIFDGGNNLLCLINDIMDLSKVEAGKLSLHIEEVNINKLCQNLSKIFNPIANSRELIFDIQVDEQLSATVSSDGQRIEQILRNLLSNAFKFTETGTVTLAIGYAAPDAIFSHSTLDAKHALSFAVSDTGIGIPANKIQAIFEAFQQQDGSTSRKYGGTGLGLTIARELTRLLGGEIQLKSKSNEGSTFTLFLPNVFDVGGVEAKSEGGEIVSDIQFSAKKSESNIANHSEVLEQNPLSGASSDPYLEFIPDDRNNLHKDVPCLLIIDDDPTFAKILRDYARESGYQCLIAGDGRVGIYMAQEYQPNGIILDIMLPDIDGHQVLEQLKYSLKTRHIPVQIISAHSEDHNAALVQGAIGLQTKPVSQQTLLSVFDEIKSFSSSELRHLLVIEDDAGNQTSIVRLLEGSDIDIKCVDNGIKGVDEILSGQYDCIILDLGLPDISGFEVLRRIEAGELDPIPPVIIYTGKEITDAQQAELNQFSSTIVIKGVGSGERLLDDISLFLHDIESRFDKDSQKTIHMFHDEDAMFQGRNVLIVDDDMRNTYALSKKLIEFGFEVEMAHNGKEAVDLLTENQSFELVLMDSMMPVMDGYEAIKQIREMSHYKQVPIISLTAKTMPEDRAKSLQAGASEYLTKPIDFDKLISILRIWLFKH